MDKRHEQMILGGLVLFGFAIRFFLAINQPVHADEVIINARAIDILSAQRISTIDQMPLFHYLLDVDYALFGVGYLTARLPSVFFGALLPVLIYFLGAYFFDKPVPLTAAALCAFSPYLLRYQPESNTIMTFFVLLSFHFYLLGTKHHYFNKIVLSFVFLGVATLLKTIALLVLPVYLLFGFFNRKRTSSQPFLVGSLFYGVMLLPLISYNLILYSQKNVLDMLFIRYFSLPLDPYAGLLTGGGLSFEKLGTNILDLFVHVLQVDPVILLGGLFGVAYILILIRSHPAQRGRFLPLLALLGIPLLFLFASSLMAKHYVTTLAILCLFAAALLCRIIKSPHLLWASIMGITLFSLFLLSDLFYKDPGVALRDISFSLPPNSLVVADSRIYRGAYLYSFYGHSIVSTGHFLEIYNYSLTQNPKELIDRPVYFLECVIDDCSGGVERFNDSVERVVRYFERKGVVIHEVSDINSLYRMHKAEIPLIHDADNMTFLVNNFFFHTTGWINPQTIVDWYSPLAPWEFFLHYFSLFLIYFSLFILFAAGILVLMWLVHPPSQS